MDVNALGHHRGLTLAFFKHFVDVHGGREAFEGLTTEQICQLFVIPYTKATKLSLVDHVERCDPDGHLYVRRATWFVSHAWNYLFLDVINALDHFMDEHNMTSEKDSAGLWFCLFNNNQHDVREQPFWYWFTTFKTALTTIGNVVMVFSPWNNPTTLTRSWCVCEVFVAIECNARFEVALSKREKETFLEHIKENDVVEIMLAKINSANSTSTFPSDRDNIFDLIEQGPGFQKLDRMVFGVLEAWVVRTLETQIALASTAEKCVQWLIVKGEMHYTKGAYPDAESIFASAVAIHNDVATTDTRPTLHWRAVMYLAMSKVKQYYARETWEPLFLDALAHQESLLGPRHAHTLETMRCFGSTYSFIEEYSLAMPLLYRCYQMAPQIGTSNEKSLATMSLGRTLIQQKHILEAQPWLEEAYGASKTAVGEYHVQTNNIGIDLAGCYARQGHFASASQLLDNIYNSQRRSLGPEAFLTLISLRALSLNLCFQGQYENLESNLLKCYDGFIALKSDGWATDCQRALGILYLCLGDHMRARIALEKTHAKFKVMFGPASTQARIIVYLLFFVSMECPEDVDSMDKIVSLESLLVDANLQHETWTEHPCHGCLEPIQGMLYMCLTCPRHSLHYCQACITDKKYEATCGHTPTQWICRMPPARFLHHARLLLFAKGAMWTDYAASFQAYQNYCDLHGVTERIEKFWLSPSETGKIFSSFFAFVS
ncbi:Aste57867_10255 [Aphanomyces stellatus]|uniref:Aste57867_10255 protein n=1 Tax=Aphanomyces stellatus TaxID=120398 RepID=A0A485KQE2_9STRA|nr:hypothetical protein As57867_010216 [Aphanomyces stellatus]VFT87130.1 Aste57867_10255 [Aphanomyces stellatus]